MLRRLIRLLRSVVLVVAGVATGVLAASLRRRPVPPAVQAADPRAGQG